MALAEATVVVKHHPKNPRGHNDLEGKYFYLRDIETEGEFSLESQATLERPNGENVTRPIGNLAIGVLRDSGHLPRNYDVPVRHSKMLFRAEIKKRPEEADTYEWVEFDAITPPRIYGPSVRSDNQKPLTDYDGFESAESNPASQKYEKEAFITRISRFLFGD